MGEWGTPGSVSDCDTGVNTNTTTVYLTIEIYVIFNVILHFSHSPSPRRSILMKVSVRKASILVKALSTQSIKES